MKAHSLIVDDDLRITDLLRRIFAFEGYSLAIATSGYETGAISCGKLTKQRRISQEADDDAETLSERTHQY